MNTPIPPEPVRVLPDEAWQHFELYERVREAVYAVPSYFTSTISIAGVAATDIFNLNAILGAAIEERVVDTLNAMRGVWDPDDKYSLYSFVRQAQTFPDVLLRHSAKHEDVILGIELKGWYLLAKEGEPSFRFMASPNVCAASDLFVVYPWHLSEVISGSPKLLPPFVESAKYAAEYRNYHWQYLMNRTNPQIELSTVSTPYPVKSYLISDRAVDDRGGNFGRVARSGLLAEFTSDAGKKLLSGIPADVWRRFLVMFKERVSDDAVERSLVTIRREIEQQGTLDQQDIESILELLRPLAQRLSS